MKFLVYTDGACFGNPGPGACASIILNNTQLVTAYQLTTNNRMELRAVIQALDFIEDDSEVTIISDSLYVVDAINKNWLNKWNLTDFYKRPNKDLWIKLQDQLKKKKCIFIWCRAHETTSHNNEADKLAKSAIKNKQKEIDIGYEHED